MLYYVMRKPMSADVICVKGKPEQCSLAINCTSYSPATLMQISYLWNRHSKLWSFTTRRHGVTISVTQPTTEF